MKAIDYLNKVTNTPKQSYQNIIQATLDSEWEDTTQIYTIKEQKAYPFIEEYEELEVYLDTISDDMINTSKVYSDFVRIIFKDARHKQNYKGQYYKIAIDDDSEEEYYICYDRINRLSQISDTKVVRCNNVLTWKDEYGNILKFPCYLGTDITSTNNQITKKSTIPNSRMIVLVQANKYTLSIRNNQRFMFQHDTCFKVEETNNYMQEQGTNGEVTCVKIYIDYSTVLPTDNKDLNICDYYDNDYSITLDQDVIEQRNGFIGSINAILRDGDKEVSLPLVWSSENESIVTIDDNGNYKVVGSVGEETIIKCSMQDNADIFSVVKVKVVQDYLPNKEIIVYPKDIKYIKQGKSQEIKYGVYIEGEKQLDDVSYKLSGANNNCYEITNTIDGMIIKNIKLSTEPLNITFKANNCEDVILKIDLKGVV